MNRLRTPTALLIVRTVWFGMLLGLGAMGAAVLTMAPGITARMPQDGFRAPVGWLIAVVAAAGAGLFVRMQVYKRHWVAGAVSPRGYVVGNVVLFVLLDAAPAAALLIKPCTGQPASILPPMFIILFIFAMNFPTGSIMQPSHPPS